MDLIPVLLIGLLGSIHCVGMCGGFVFALAQNSTHRLHFLQKQTAYYLGKTLTYTLLGALVGALGHALSTLFTRFQIVLSISLGLVLVFMGLGMLGILKRYQFPALLRPWKNISAMMGKLLGKGSRSAPFALGLMNGLLPCGLVYAALVLAAASGTFSQGMLIMGVFGISTIPALFATAIAGVFMKPAWRHQIHMISGVILIGLGLLTVYRGLPGTHDAHGSSPSHQHIEEHHPNN